MNPPASVPDLCLALASLDLPCPLVIIGCRALLIERARLLGLDVELVDYLPGAAAGPHQPGRLACSTCRWRLPVSPDASTPPMRAMCSPCSTARSDGAVSGEFDAIVTAPVQKSVINDAGVPFTGHTEYLAERTGAPIR